jgi:hypothetical protein
MVGWNTTGTIRTEGQIKIQGQNPDTINIAVRVFPDRVDEEEQTRFDRPWTRPTAMLVFDTETRTDATQRLTFGCYRFIVDGECKREGLFYADDLPEADRRVLEHYVAIHKAEAVDKNLHLLPRREFVDLLYRAAYKGRCLLVGFNLPFDLSRIACDFTDARRRFTGGFSLGLLSYTDKQGDEQSNKYRPRIDIKHIDSKRALKGFTGRRNPDNTDLIPEGSPTGKPEESYKFRGHFLDLRTLAFALTDRGFTLKTACDEFHVDHPKEPTTKHGIVTEDYIHYNRRDVLATWELAIKLLEEYDKHPIALQETKAYSPASIGKWYLRAMGITPILERQPDFPKQYLGHAQSSFVGGRTSAHIRKVAVPVVYTDFLSMYTTVNGLMNLWQFVIAQEIHLNTDCKTEITKFLEHLTVDAMFKPATWGELTAFVKVIPDGDILPLRAKYSSESNDWQVGVNHVYADPENALWYTLPDIAASVLLTKRIPKIVDAFRIVPHGTLDGLQRVKLRNAIEVDPRPQDFFRVAIEQRKLLSKRMDISDDERKRLDKSLKVLANATSYGIYAEMNRQESEKKTNVTCYGIDSDPFTCRVAHPDIPGEYCFPPIAALITGAARLMLSLLEACVVEAGGTYAMEDTDSMAIVATESGGNIQCNGQNLHALSRNQVEQISQRFQVLSPYNRDAIDTSILKIESDNNDPLTNKPRQVYCYAISAKRYALFIKDKRGNPVLLRASCPACGRKNNADATVCIKCSKPIQVNNEDDRWSEHGLGHLLNPTDPNNEDREWIAQTWESIIRRALDIATPQVMFQKSPAVGRTTVSSTAVMRPFKEFNEGKKYAHQIKPFNFLLTCHVQPFGHPRDVDPQHFHLIAPYETDSKKWLQNEWFDQYSGKTYRINTTGDYGTKDTAQVKTYGEVLLEYEFHAESKCADANGKPCDKQTVGLLQRRHVRIGQVTYIGKETNKLEEVESGLIHSAENVYTEYPDPRRSEWSTKTLPTLKSLSLAQAIKLFPQFSRRMLIDARSGRSTPHPRSQQLIAAVISKQQQKKAAAGEH